ncbi:MAG: hypothetical protein AB7T31_00995 [Gemmatimonadales bacterium]
MRRTAPRRLVDDASEDLAKFPENGWSLHGLATSLREQGNAAEAAEVEADFRRVWETADAPPPEWAAASQLRAVPAPPPRAGR